MMFEVESGGVRYEVEAPDMDTAARKLQELKQDAPAPFREQQEPYTGTVLPMSRDAEGNVGFDSNAGIVGAVKRAFTLPHEVVTGKVDPSSPEGIERVFEMGAVFSPVNPAVRSGERAIAGTARAGRPGKPVTPTREELKAAGSSGYNEAEAMGVAFSSDAVRDMAVAARQDIRIHESLAPKSYKILSELENPPPNSIATLDGLIAAKRNLRAAAKDFNNPTEQKVAVEIIKRLDDFTNNPDPASVVAGPAAAAGRIKADADANYAAGARSKTLNKVEAAKLLRAKSANSGQNLDNSIRQGIASLLLDEKKIAGFSKGEIKYLVEVVEGTSGRNFVRFLGNLLGGGGGLGTALTAGGGAIVGSTVGQPAIGAVAAPAIGAAAKALANKLTARGLRLADEAVRQRSPLYEQRVQNPPLVPASPTVRSAVPRAVGVSGRPPMTEGEYQEYLASGGT